MNSQGVERVGQLVWLGGRRCQVLKFEKSHPNTRCLVNDSGDVKWVEISELELSDGNEN